jgi:MbtH protein
VIRPDTEADLREYAVVINHEEQYSIWPLDQALPPGWDEVGVRGLREQCLEYIAQVWTDIRPRSSRSGA